MSKESFLYFAYGSNLLMQRLHMNSPSAVRIGCGKLNNYRLDFNTYSNRWKGASATIVPTENRHVWGSIWKIDLDHLPNLDQQEGVHQNIYFAFETKIETETGDTFLCRLYQQVNQPEPHSGVDFLPEHRRPSEIYLSTIIRGAFESNLPTEYQTFLKSIPHNGYNGPANLSLLLNK